MVLSRLIKPISKAERNHIPFHPFHEYVSCNVMYSVFCTVLG